MDKIILEGGVPLNGTVAVSGSKNAALPLMAASLITPGRHVLHNVPDLRDTRTMLKVLETLGTRWSREGGTVYLDTSELTGAEAPYELVKTMRASVLVLGPLLARVGLARVSLPGGCAIGARPINYHVRGFEQLGVKTILEKGYVEASAQGRRLQGNVVYFDNPTVTGTENLLMASVTASGTTVIKNAAREPEVGNLIDMLVSMGAEIEGRDSDRLTVHGVERLAEAEATIIPDRIEAGTYLIAAAAAGGEVTVQGCIPDHLPSLVEKLRGTGVQIKEHDTSFTVTSPGWAEGSSNLRSVDIRTMPYPGFPTDLQAQFMALMTTAEGVSVIHETIFENRFMHVAELQRMGADIKIDGCTAIVTGKKRGEL
jgi:UDP-N-acetylglucosamine 1-carboxyvinyltransferase